jgi:hypothetical protein
MGLSKKRGPLLTSHLELVAKTFQVITLRLDVGIEHAHLYGMPKNYIKAYAWFKIAAAQKSTKALSNLRKLESHMTTEQIYYAKKLSKQYYETFVAPFKN